MGDQTHNHQGGGIKMYDKWYSWDKNKDVHGISLKPSTSSFPN